MIHRFVCHNGQVLPIEQARLSPGQAGLLNGWGLFTTIRIIEGQPFALERHWRRLEKDAARIHCPFPFRATDVREQLAELARANHFTEGCARIYAVYNQIGFWRSDEGFPAVDLLLYTAPLPAYREPAKLAVRANGRFAASPLAGAKVTSWLNSVWCLHEAQQHGCDEAVLLNERGEVAECTAANIFCASQGRVITPPLGSGCLEGVTRAILLEIASPAGVPIEEKTLYPSDLYRAEEVFITSTNRNVLAVGEIAGRKMAAAPGPLARKLDHAFAHYIAKYLSRNAEEARRSP